MMLILGIDFFYGSKNLVIFPIFLSYKICGMDHY